MKCELCELHYDSLEDSHYIPKSVYRTMMHSRSGSNNYILSFGKSYPLPIQVTRPLLCKNCEGKFSKKGEDFFARHLLWRRASELPSFYKQITAMLMRSKFPKGYSFGASFLSESTSLSLCYFAMSIVWRASFDWGKVKEVVLDPSLKEELRMYLLGLGNYPKGYIVRVSPIVDCVDIQQPYLSQGKMMGVVFPMALKGGVVFRILKYDFVFEKNSSLYERVIQDGLAPIFYTGANSTSDLISKKQIELYLESEKASAIQKRGEEALIVGSRF